MRLVGNRADDYYVAMTTTCSPSIVPALSPGRACARARVHSAPRAVTSSRLIASVDIVPPQAAMAYHAPTGAWSRGVMT